MEKRNRDDEFLVEYRDANLRWLITEAIHSTNNFLGGISYATYFLRQEEDLELEENLQIINRRVEGAAGVLKALHSLVSPLSEARDRVNLIEVMKRIEELFSHKLKGSKVEICNEISPEAWIEAKDERLICQVIYTWLWLRFTEFSEPGRVVVNAEQRQHGGLWLKFTDNGPGGEWSKDSRMTDLLSFEAAVQSGDRGDFALNCLRCFQRFLTIEWDGRPVGGVVFHLKVRPIFHESEESVT